MKERSATMYYFNQAFIYDEASLPRILAEDTGATELRDPVFQAKTEFKFRKPSWLKRKERFPAACICPKPSPASC